MSVPIDLVWITVCHYGFTTHTDINTLSPLFQQQQTPHLHETCIKWAEKSSWCHCWQLQHSTSSKDSSMCLSGSCHCLCSMFRQPYWCHIKDFYNLICESCSGHSRVTRCVLTLLRIAVKIVHYMSACSTPVAIAFSYCRLRLCQSHYSECISIIPLSSHRFTVFPTSIPVIGTLQCVTTESFCQKLCLRWLDTNRGSFS